MSASKQKVNGHVASRILRSTGLHQQACAAQHSIWRCGRLPLVVQQKGRWPWLFSCCSFCGCPELTSVAMWVP